MIRSNCTKWQPQFFPSRHKDMRHSIQRSLIPKHLCSFVCSKQGNLLTQPGIITGHLHPSFDISSDFISFWVQTAAPEFMTLESFVSERDLPSGVTLVLCGFGLTSHTKAVLPWLQSLGSLLCLKAVPVPYEHSFAPTSHLVDYNHDTNSSYQRPLQGMWRAPFSDYFHCMWA